MLAGIFVEVDMSSSGRNGRAAHYFSSRVLLRRKHASYVGF
jgi:hypothetical protein